MQTILPAYKALGERRYRGKPRASTGRISSPATSLSTGPAARKARRRQHLLQPCWTLNIQQVHFDAAYAAKTEWKKMLVRLDLHPRASDRHERCARSAPRSSPISAGTRSRPPTPSSPATSTAFYAESTVISKRESKSRPTQGIVTVSTRGINQDSIEVMSFERTMLVHRRGHSPEEAANY